ncbi:MAG: proline dehydrogenase family protein [Actinobacteria bacterium]|nr:proline dehydrogenase family protein [Actinomycetota bacterium]
MSRAPTGVSFASLALNGRRRLRVSVRRRSGRPASRDPGVRGEAGRDGAGGSARAVRDAHSEHGRRADGGGAQAGAGERGCRPAGDRASGRHARSLPRGGRARERRSPGLHARTLVSRAVALLDRAIVRLLPAVPRPLVQKLSARYIAGPSLADARRVVAELNAQGKLATVDVLGEEITQASEAEAIADEYVAALDAFERDGLDANVSVKPTGLGLKLDYDLCKRNIERVIAAAEPTNRFVRIDMEDSSTTDDTLRLFRELRDEGHARVGPVLQASLRRTVADAESLAGASVRLCKGIYVEPEPIQFRDDEAVRVSFVRALEALLDGGCYAAIATHDEWLVEQALRLVRERELGPEQYEFQMLLGVRPELGDSLVQDGHRLRIYVPYGSKWYEYSLRRLQENPKVAGYIAADTLGRLLPRR